jgi:lysophospholipase L1-like esterase
LFAKHHAAFRPAFWIVGLGVICLVLASCGGSSKITPQISWTDPSPISYGTALSATQLDATTSVPGTYVYSPSLGAVLSAGSQTLSVNFTPTDTATYATVTASVTLKVEPLASPAITWSAPAAIPYGTALSAAQLNANESIPGVFVYSPSLGAVIPAGLQTLSVTFTPTDPNYSVVNDSVTITVSQAAPVLSWAAPAAIPYGTALSGTQLNAASSVPGAFAYSPSAGTQLSLGSHLLSATFTPSDSRDYTSATASVTLTVTQAAPQITWPTPAPITYGTALSRTQLNAASTIAGSYSYSPALGTVLTAGTQTLSVTFTPTDATDYTTAQASVQLKVNQATPAISWAAPAAIIYGTALSGTQLNAGSTVAGTLTYSPALGAVLTAGTQTLSVTFTPTDATDYTTAKASVPLTVNQAMPAISWTAPAAITYGTALNATQLDATANLPGTFVYAPSIGAVLTAGTQTLSVTFTPTDAADYTTTQASVPLTVNQATPAVSWTAPAAITYGTALSGTQLNARSTVAGTLTYSPALGALLTAGTQMLSVTFTPTDATDYTTTQASVPLTVNPATPMIAWTPTAQLAVGSPLGPGQLNAAVISPGGTTALGGSFVYTPPAGTIFTSPGPQTLSTTFTPYDTSDYTTAQASILMTASVFGVAAWGDSLTEGTAGSLDVDPYPSELQELLTLPVVNLGIDGQTSTQIGVREGGVSAVVSIDGGVIPASGGVTVTFPTCSASNCPIYTPVTPYGPDGGLSGTILGVHGTVTIDNTGTILTFARTTPGSEVSAPGTPAFVVDTPYANYIPVFWEGRNDFAWTGQILSDLAGQVATVAPGQDYVVLSVINENRPVEWYGASGNFSYQWLIPFNEQLGSIYGSHYMDIRKILVDAYDPAQATDVTDYQHDEPPSSLRAILMESTLASAIGPADTSITLNATKPPNRIPVVTTIVKIDDGANAENVQVTAVNGDTLTVTRGFGGTQTAHAAGAPIVALDMVHLNAQGHQIVANAVAQYLSAYAK